MTKVTIHAAKTNLSKLIAQVEAGEEVVICRGAQEVVRMIPIKAANDVSAFAPWDGKSPRTPGSLKGIIGPTSEEDFAPLTDEEIDEFFGSPVFPPEQS
jgi:prevent-host-death family protein